MLFSLTKSRTAEKDRAAFESLLRQSQRQAYGYAFRLCGNAHDAEDLMQEAYVRAYKFFHRYDENLPFTAWLFRIMSNAHIDIVRRKNRIKSVSLDGHGEDGKSDWEIADETSTPDREMLDGALEDVVEKGLSRLNPEFRQAVVLADLEGMAYDEVAVVMNTSVGTVRSRIHRGRKMLRNYLKVHAPELYGRYEDDLS